VSAGLKALDMDQPEDLLKQLAAAGELGDDELPLAETALILAALDHKAIDLAPYRAHLAKLAEDARAGFTALRRGMTEVEALARTLADTIAVRHGYAGDSTTFDDPQNADLIRVIDRRRGLPVSLGILYIETARRLGVSAKGLNTPGHFLLALGDEERAKVIDPFNAGVVLNREELRPVPPTMQGEVAEYGPVSARDVLLRLLNNIRTRALAGKDMIRTLTIMERMVLVAPRRPDLWLDLANANREVGKLNGAIRAAESCLRLAGDRSSTGREAAFVLHSLKRMVN
jgi:regulator of sirC expression with transglutaminase-like and TPR domain